MSSDPAPTPVAIGDMSLPHGSRAGIVIVLILALAGVVVQGFAVKMAFDVDLKPTPEMKATELAALAAFMVGFIMACGLPFTAVAGIITLVGACRRTDLRGAYRGLLAMVIVVEILLVGLLVTAIERTHEQAVALDQQRAATTATDPATTSDAPPTGPTDPAAPADPAEQADTNAPTGGTDAP